MRLYSKRKSISHSWNLRVWWVSKCCTKIYFLETSSLCSSYRTAEKVNFLSHPRAICPCILAPRSAVSTCLDTSYLPSWWVSPSRLYSRPTFCHQPADCLQLWFEVLGTQKALNRYSLMNEYILPVIPPLDTLLFQLFKLSNVQLQLEAPAVLLNAKTCYPDCYSAFQWIFFFSSKFSHHIVVLERLRVY